jgi:deazaflavin-dependent oxidoreductase (nitroreductase family)
MTEPELQAPTLRERQKFAAGGATWFHPLRGRWGMDIDRTIVRWTGFSVVTWQFAVSMGTPYLPTLLLTTIGRKSGELRTVALPYWRVGDELVLLGTKGGGAENPAWSFNIISDPHCWLRIRRRDVCALGRVAAGEERARLYPQLCGLNPKLARYQESAARFGREIPLVVLTPRTPVPH